MIVSNEPGYYEDGAFGIRIENLLVRVMLLQSTIDGVPFQLALPCTF